MRLDGDSKVVSKLPSIVLAQRYLESNRQDKEALTELARRATLLALVGRTSGHSLIEGLIISVVHQLVTQDVLVREVSKLLETLTDAVFMLIANKLQQAWDEPRVQEEAAKESAEFLKSVMDRVQNKGKEVVQ